MKLSKTLSTTTGWAVCLVFAMAVTAEAASSLSNSLTGFTGESSLEATQTALAGAGLEFASTAGLAPDNSNDPRIAFDANGASFGTFFVGNEGRNYMRTIEADYAFTDWTAYVTIVVDTLGTDDTWFGMGSGDITNWGTPDWFGVPGVFMAPQDGVLSSNATDGITGDWYTPPPCTQGWCGVNSTALVGANPGTHRLRMTFDFETKTWIGAIDVDFAGGAFTADVTTLTYVLTDMFDDGGFIQNGWPTNPSKIYFGGDDGVIFKDLSIVVGTPPAEDADFDDDGDIDGRDFLTWQKNYGTGTTNATGDANGDGMVNGADLGIWQSQYGGGSLAAIGVPEPSAMLLLLSAVGAATLKRRA